MTSGACSRSPSAMQMSSEKRQQKQPPARRSLQNRPSARVRVDQRFALVIQDDRAAQTALRQQTCGGEDECGFSRTQETTDDHQMGTNVQAAVASFRVLPSAIVLDGSKRKIAREPSRST